MKLQKILEVTKLSKKAIYFYIKEGLIIPNKNLDNGYYDFSIEDLNRLQVIVSLRKIGMSIQDIKDLFLYPTLTNFFIHRQINNLKNNIVAQINQLQASYYLINEIPANATPKNLDLPIEVLSKQSENSESYLNKYFPNVDSRMIAILLYAPFMDATASEYHNFLWDKISTELRITLEQNLNFLKRLVYKLTPKQIYTTSLIQYEICKEISQLEENELEEYANILYEKCLELLKGEKMIEYWTLLYEPITKPLLSFFSQKSAILLGEYNPRYTKYTLNMKKIATNVLIKMDTKLMDEISEKLSYKFDPQSCDYSELIMLYLFKHSIFMQLKLEELKEILEK